MINILLESYDFDAPWLYDKLKQYIKPHHTVAVVALSFRDSRVKSLADWNALYSKESGQFYTGIVDAFRSYGIAEEQVHFINYFADTTETASQKIVDADILYFLGGLPDKMMERICKMKLQETLSKHNGIVMGYSAGAVIQLNEYHLAADDDYPVFGFYNGLAYIDQCYLQVHYDGNASQQDAIRKVIAERGKPVYATSVGQGAVVVDNGEIRLLGDVKRFD